MEGNTEYDLLLRSVFDSCDRTGSGLLSPTEFEDLCSQLCLEDEYKLLHKTLFTSKPHLSYERFREGLLLLLAGALTEHGCTEELKGGTEDISGMQHSRSDSLGRSTSEEEPGNHGNEDLNDNDVKQRTAGDGCKATDNANHSDWMVIDFRGGERSPSVEKMESKDSSQSERGKRYGRRTLPDMDLLNQQNAKQPMDNCYRSPLAKSGQLGLFDDVTIRSDHVMSSLAPAEEFVGEGDGSEWTSPDQNSFRVYPEEDVAMEAGHDTSADEAQEALGAIWRQIIGGIDEKINIEQLQQLYSALSLTSSGGDVMQLFQVLDSDGDGLICFGDFARQMSAFLTGGDDVTEPPTSEQRTDYDVFGVKGANLHSTPYSNRTNTIQTPGVGEFLDPPLQSTPHFAPNRSSTVTSPLRSSSPPSACDVTQSPADRNSTSGFMSSPTSHHSTPTSSADSCSTFSTTGRRASDSNDDAMSSYHGVPSYRRRRRSNQHATRHHRRRTNSKTMSLPHYHPISRCHLEDCLLYFLTGENGRYVEVENLRTIWKEEGIEDPDEVLKKLGVNLDDSFSIEALSEVLDSEVKDSVVHHATCAIYKSGIRYYRSQREHDSSEKAKLESRIEHLDSQLLEQEERIEKMEIEYNERLEEVESQYKEEIYKLDQKLESASSQCDRRNDKEIKRYQSRIENMQEVEQHLREELAVMESDNKQLVLGHNKIENELNTAESNLERLRADFDMVCRQMALCSQSNAQQQGRMEVLLEEYRIGAQKLQDENDELMGHLEAAKRRWALSEQSKPPREDKPNSEHLSQPVRRHSGTSPSLKPTSPPTLNRSGHWQSRDFNEIQFMAVPTGSRGFSSSNFSGVLPRTPRKSSLTWLTASDPDASFSHVASASANISAPHNLLSELKSSSASGIA